MLYNEMYPRSLRRPRCCKMKCIREACTTLSIQSIHDVMELLAHSQYESMFSSTALVSYISCVSSLVTYVCACGGITSLGFSVDWTSSSLSRVDLSGLSWHRSCPGHLWEAAVVWAPAHSAVYLCLCLAIKRRVLQCRVIFTP